MGEIETFRDALDTGVDDVRLLKNGELVASGYWDGEVVDGERTYAITYEGDELPLDTTIIVEKVYAEMSDGDIATLICEIEEK